MSDGYIESVIQAGRPEDAPGEPPADVDVWEENRRTVELFEKVRTAWIVVLGLGGMAYSGLDYTRVRSYLCMKRIRDQDEVIDELQLMEWAALPILNGKPIDE